MSRSGAKRAAAAVLVLVFGLVSLDTRIVEAQTDPFESLTDEQVAELLETLEQARDLEADELWAEALDLYLRAEEIAPLDQYRYRQAVCLEQLDRYDEALAIYIELQESSDENVARGSRMRIGPLEELVLRAPRPVVLHTQPDEVQVVIDEGDVDWSEGGVYEITLEPGRHQLEVSAEGYETHSAVIEVEPGPSNEFTVALSVAAEIAEVPPRDNGPSVVTWTLAGGSAAFLITGMTFGILSNKRAEEERTYNLQEADNRDEVDRLAQQANDYATVANVCFITGGVLAVGALVTYFVFDWQGSESAPADSGVDVSIAPVVSPEATGGLLRVVW